MTRYDNTAATNTLADATTLTAASSGKSGLPFTAVTPGSGGTIVHSLDRAADRYSGPWSYKFAAAAATNCYVSNSYSAPAKISSARIDFLITGQWTAATQFFRFYSPSGNVARFGLSNTGTSTQASTVQVGVSQGTLASTAGIIPYGVWCRAYLAVSVGTSATTGVLNIKVVRLDTGASLFALSNSACDLGTVAPTQIGAGKISNAGNAAPFYMKNFAFDDNSSLFIPDEPRLRNGWGLAS